MVTITQFLCIDSGTSLLSLSIGKLTQRHQPPGGCFRALWMYPGRICCRYCFWPVFCKRLWCCCRFSRFPGNWFSPSRHSRQYHAAFRSTSERRGKTLPAYQANGKSAIDTLHIVTGFYRRYHGKTGRYPNLEPGSPEGFVSGMIRTLCCAG